MQGVVSIKGANLQMKSEFEQEHYLDIRLWLFVTLCDKSIFSLLWNCTVVLYQYTIRRYTHFPSGNMQRTRESILQILSIITDFWYDHLQKYLKPIKIIIIGPESDHCSPLSLTHSLTESLLFSKLDWCDPGVWRCQLKTCWCCNCCWWGSCGQHFFADFKAEVWSKS